VERVKDKDHPFFRPLWRRVAVVVLCAAWSGWEFSYGEEFWGMMALAMTVYAGWTYLWTYREPAATAVADEAQATAPPEDEKKE
jgi:hypothetical protein